MRKFAEFMQRTEVVMAAVLAVCFLIFVVPLYSSPVVPQPGGWGEDSGKSELQGIYIVDGMRPSKLTDAVVQLGVKYVEAETGWDIPEVKTGPLPAATCASWDAEGWSQESSAVHCLKGWILVMQDDRLLAGAPTDGRQTHGRTFLGDEDRDGWPDFPQDWATIVLTDGSLEPDDPEADGDLPANAYANLWTHELLHGLGYHHTFTRIIPGVNAVTMERTGHILNKNLLEAGWDGAGLDLWDRSRKSSYKKRLE